MDKNLRIHTNIASDTILNVNMQQDYDFLEVLSIKLRQKDAYKLHSSNYGVIIGRVLANDAFGIPNAKISVFIPRDNDDASDLESIYPYAEVTSKDKEGRRYNLLPDYSDDECYRIVGTFPNKRLMLDNDSYLEVYDKYWKYSTVTNNAGDYMIFGVPTGNQQIHVDIDLSDIGILSQKPRDFEYKGYNVSMFDNPNQFKESTNLDSLAQLFSQNKSVFVYPFWGDDDNGVAAITRSDIQIQYKFEPTCVFMGSIISDNDGNSIGHKCSAEVDNGMNEQLIAGEGTIEMIRKTTDGLIEEYQIQGNQLINENGVWCYQIPMNLDFVGTDEYGNIVPTDNPNKGIPTRTQVRFRFSKNETGGEGFSRHTAKYLVPMNPRLEERNEREGIRPMIPDRGQDIEKMYTFGSSTPDSCFRDLYWNNVYSVKNYIPKAQVAHRPYSKNYTALKGSNLVDDQNPLPFNKLRVDIPFMYMIVCILFTIVTYIVTVINMILSFLHFLVYEFCIRLYLIGKICPFGVLGYIFDLMGGFSCISLGGGLSEDNTAYYPGCSTKAMRHSDCPKDMENGCKPSNDSGDLMDKVQQKLAQDYKIVKLDFYQDWLNGSLYMPLWFWRKRKKKTFLFFTISRAKNEFCDCNKRYSRLKTYVTCNVKYNGNSFELNDSNVPESENSWHRAKGRAKWVRYLNGLIKGVENNDGLTSYYYAAVQATSDNKDPALEMSKRETPFYAVRLYATDIILLGNLDENNIYGIPQFFKALPSTTANIPPIAVVEELDGDDETDEKYSENEVARDEDSGTSVTTGMDWGHEGDEDTPLYKKGLFIDLACTYAHSKAKSCFNVERLSELGVSLDTTYDMSYAKNANGIETGPIYTDGFITKYELEDMENRAMFATMNHIGFVPQSYQDTISGYTTQVEDENTGYLIPKFKYIYPVDFDGRMQPLMNRYKGNFTQSQFDDADESYITFRLGAEKTKELEYDRIRHFYYTQGGTYEMPLFNNSFYFYFGIKKGSTAIDKFNELFYSQCFKNSKQPFSLNIDVRGRSYCPEIYTRIDEAYGYIRVQTDDIQVPYSYTLYDAFGNLVIYEDNMTTFDFVIGGYIEEGKVKTNTPNGIVKYQLDETKALDNIYGVSGLTNQEYILDITDANGKTISNKVKLDMSKIEFQYETRNLGTKYYNTQESRIENICNDDTNFYGIIRITKFFVDSYEYRITDAVVGPITSDYYTVYVAGTPKDENAPIGTAQAVFYLYSLEQEQSVRDCLCDNGNNVPYKTNMSIADALPNPYFINLNASIGENIRTFEFYIYKPSAFIGKIAQRCDEGLIELEENSTSSIIQILNGENFNTYLSTMPTRFIIGTTSDSNQATVGNTSNFYRSTAVTSTTAAGMVGWFGVHQETSYQFNLPINQTLESNRGIWSDFLTIGASMSDVRTKKTILRYKFKTMFKLSDATYITNSSTKVFTYTSTGGASPVLTRMVSPYYRNNSKMFDTYIYADDNMASMPQEYANIVGSNYRDNLINKSYELDCNEESPRFNRMYHPDSDEERKYLGNYFAAFTSNGRYITSTSGDCSINIQQLPNYAPVNLENEWKRLGREKTPTEVPPKAHTQSNEWDGLCNNRRNTLPYLRAMSIDRRFDYNLNVFAPIQSTSFALHSTAGEERPWKSGRVSGTTYGGIEMSYDTEYNIISADMNTFYYVVDDENNVIYNNKADAITAAKNKYPKYCYRNGEQIDCETCTEENPCQYESNEDYDKRINEECIGELEERTANLSKRLEYSYYVASGDTNAYTEYNIPNDPNNIVWQKWNDTDAGTNLYQKGDADTDDNEHQVTKMLYEAYIDNHDVRQLFWSDFNKERLNNYGTLQYGTSGLYNLNLDYYVYNHYTDNGYNGDFNMSTAPSYPTKRIIDIGNIRQSKEIYMDFISCGYGINTELTDDGELIAYARSGEENEIILDFDDPIKIVNPNPDNKDYGNIIFSGVTSETIDGVYYRTFTAITCNMSFNYNRVSHDDFYIYTYYPRLIRVLPYIEVNGQKTDGITYYKTASKSGELFGTDDLKTRIDDNITFYHYNSRRVDVWFIHEGNVYMPEGVDFYEYDSRVISCLGGDNWGETFKKDGEILASDSGDFSNILFSNEKDGIPLSEKNVTVFTVLVIRDYFSQQQDHLTKHIRTFETSSLFDSRKVSIGVSQDREETFVQMSTIGFDGHVDVPTVGSNVTINTDDQGQATGGSVSVGSENQDVSGGGQTHIQTVTFLMRFPKVDDPQQMYNQAFADYSLMGYTFKFTDNNGSNYYLPATVSAVTSNTLTVLHLTVRFSEDMGILADKVWDFGGGKGAKVILLAKAPSGFTYKLNEFRLQAVIHQAAKDGEEYDRENKKSNMEENVKYVTITKILAS